MGTVKGKNKLKLDILFNCGVFILFATLSMVCVFPLLRTGHVYYGDDIAYHLNRVNELVQDIHHGNWYPFFYSFNFDKINFPLGIFYPQITLIPFALLVIWTGSYIKGIYYALGIVMFIALGSSYIVGQKFWHRRMPAFFTAIFYGFGLYFSIDMITRADYGETCAMAFLPLVLYGFYAILRGEWKDWPYLGFGLAAVMMSHVLSTFIDVLFMAVVFIAVVWTLDNKRNRIIAGLKAIIIFFLSSAVFIGPFLVQESFEHFKQPLPIPLDAAPGFDEIFRAMLRNSMARAITGNFYTIGFIGLVIIVCGFVFYHFLNETEKFCLIVGTLLVLSTSTLMPLELLDKTFVSVIQFAFRVLGIASFLIAVVGGKLADKFIMRYQVFGKVISRLLLVCLLVIAPWWSTMRNFRVTAQPVPNNDLFQSAPISPGAWYLVQYLPAKSMPAFNDIRNRIAVIDGRKVKLNDNEDFHSIPNGIIYRGSTFSNVRTINFPVPVYKNERVQINGRDVSYQVSSRGTVKLTNVHLTPNSQIKVYYQPSIFDYCVMTVSIIAWLGGTGLLVIRKIGWRKKNGAV